LFPAEIVGTIQEKLSAYKIAKQKA
jgi:hypothetical protein